MSYSDVLIRGRQGAGFCITGYEFFGAAQTLMDRLNDEAMQAKVVVSLELEYSSSNESVLGRGDGSGDLLLLAGQASCCFYISESTPTTDNPAV